MSRDGYVVLPAVLDDAEIATMRLAIDDLLQIARRDPFWHAGGTLHLDGLAGPRI